MKRFIDWYLRHWKEDPRRKPLLLCGARQVGKTFVVRQLANTFESVVEINFELMPQAKNIFEQDLMPERIIWELGLLTHQTRGLLFKKYRFGSKSHFQKFTKSPRFSCCYTSNWRPIIASIIF